ncbi:unnamed protein product [Closterium sp. NIES-54]
MAGLLDMDTPVVLTNAAPSNEDVSAVSAFVSSLRVNETNSGPAVPVGGDASGLAHILGIGTANPDRKVTQAEFHEKFVTTLPFPDKKTEDLSKRIIENCGIKTRHLVHDSDIFNTYDSIAAFGSPSLDTRLKLWLEPAVALGKAASERAISDWGGDRKDITHVITFSTSGIHCPGLDMCLIKQMGLPQSTKHLYVSYMGCHAGVIGLRTAAEIAAGDPSHRVLVVAVEVNSVNAQSLNPDNLINNIIVDCIFADGAGAFILGAKPREGEKAVFEVHRHGTTYIPDSEDVITANVVCHGLDVGLKKNLPELVGNNVNPFVRSLVGNLSYSDMLWAVHPGGKSIVDMTQRGCGLKSKQVQVSRDILREYANMASCTIMFVLDKVRRDNRQKEGDKWTLALAFGPGVSVEGTLLRLVDPRTE